MCKHPCNSELKPDTCMYLGDDIHPCNQASYIQISPQGRATVYHVPRTHMYLHRYMHAWMHGPAIVNNKNKKFVQRGSCVRSTYVVKVPCVTSCTPY